MNNCPNFWHQDMPVTEFASLDGRRILKPATGADSVVRWRSPLPPMCRARRNAPEPFALRRIV